MLSHRTGDGGAAAFLHGRSRPAGPAARRGWTAAPRATCRKPRPRSSDWRPLGLRGLRGPRDHAAAVAGPAGEGLRRRGSYRDYRDRYRSPSTSFRWLEQPDELPSLTENDGYFLSCQLLALFGSVYDPGGENATDATCWAGVATDAELTGLPPHVISVNELDPLRDEGLVYYRRLLRAPDPNQQMTLARSRSPAGSDTDPRHRPASPRTWGLPTP